jgi:hypothetical protein
MTYSPLRRVYAFSDTYGRSKNPFLQDDADALLCTDFRSFPLETVHREFDIYGREAVTAHLVRLIFGLTEDAKQYKYTNPAVKEEFEQSLTGIFINAAPRIGKDNGHPFYVATSGNIRIVTTDLAALSTVKHKIETLAHLPNEGNVVFSSTEQFRSSYTPYLLHPDHGVDLVQDSVEDTIPDYPEEKWELSYVDRFGNMITYCSNPEARLKEIQKAADKDGMVMVLVGNVSQKLYVGSSLRDAEPGSLVVYQNGDIDILRKWMAGEDSYSRLYKSAFLQYAKPEIGAKIEVLG